MLRWNRQPSLQTAGPAARDRPAPCLSTQQHVEKHSDLCLVWGQKRVARGGFKREEEVQGISGGPEMAFVSFSTRPGQSAAMRVRTAKGAAGH